MAPLASRSVIWRSFTKVSKELSQCKICSKKLKTSGNTSNLKNHLKQKHTNVYEQLFCNEEDEAPAKKIKHSRTETTKESIATDINDRPLSPSSTITLQSEGNLSSSGVVVEEHLASLEMIDSTPSTSGTRCSIETSFIQPTITKVIKDVRSFSDGGSKNIKITQAVVGFVINDNMPFNVVEGKGFVNLMKELAPMYRVPTRNTIKDRVDKQFEVMSGAFKTMIKNINHFTVTTDIWTADMQAKSFIGVTIHFIKDLLMLSATLGVSELDESHTAGYISSILASCLNEWDIDMEKVVAIVTDNGANMVKAAQDLVGKQKHVPCFAHTLNLLCENAVKNTANLLALIEKVRAIVIWFKRSVYASDELRKVQKSRGILEGNCLKLILDIKTRWNSTYFMIERFLKLAPLLGTIILSNMNAPNMVNATELEELKQICQLLHPLEQTTKEMSGQNYVTLSKIIPMIGCLTSQYNKTSCDTEIARNLKTSIIKEFDKRFGYVEKCFLLAASTILDPRFKNIHFQDPLALSTIIRHLKNEITNAPDQSSSSSDLSDKGEEEQATFDLWAHHKNIAHTKKSRKTEEKFDELNQYLSVPVRSLKEDPQEIWDEMKTVYPNLYKLAQKYISVVATSVPSERLFSKAGATMTKNRNRLTGKRLSKLLFLGSLPENFSF
ncbi:zinc finger BED domain-containing protein 4-like [Sitophilus oryzae]|uniref:Zinc finger BED domain-containing protein 4-like n=1 Tax=Sitophilus oryzae TaxID=7048 RepID=A0A6J2XHU0_SITOR|nr:zinc finger BED domain-containing protein 4-like [Sitophilus oryzae]